VVAVTEAQALGFGCIDAAGAVGNRRIHALGAELTLQVLAVLG
jgi:hypothetical protein